MFELGFNVSHRADGTVIQSFKREDKDQIIRSRERSECIEYLTRMTYCEQARALGHLEWGNTCEAYVI